MGYFPKMPQLSLPPLSFRRPRVHERPEVLALALSLFPPERQRQAVATILFRPVAELDGLYGAWRGERLVGAVWGEVFPGRSAMAHPPQVIAGEPADTGLALLARLEQFFVSQAAQFYQTQLECETDQDVAILRAAGLERVAELIFLTCDPAANAPPQSAAWEFEPYRESERARLMAVIEQTYQGSLDLPALDGMRSLDDVLEGYRHTGAWRPEFWQFVRCGDRDAGCLFLAEHQPHQTWEIVYLGVMPHARGQGGGAAITRHARQFVHQAGGRRLLLAVDAENSPALRIYRQAGFSEFQRRPVFLKALRDATSARSG